MKIKKYSVVSNVVPLRANSYTDKILPVGTIGTVWKVSRDGMCSVSFKDSHNSLNLSSEVLKLIDVPKKEPKPGDLFYTSWGYEQTNIDFYQVVSFKGQTVVVVSVASERTYDGPMSGNCKPVKDKICGQSFSKRVTYDNEGNPCFKIASYAMAWPTDEKTEHFFSEWH